MAVWVGVNVRCIVFRLTPLIGAAGLLLGGCQAPAPTAGAKPNFAPAAPDVRTDAAIQEMENQYIAEKNSQPTHQYQAEQKKKKQEQEKAARAEAARKAAEAAKAAEKGDRESKN